MVGTAVLVVEVIGVLPDIESQEGPQAVNHRVVGTGILADGKDSGIICLKPDPAAAEDRCPGCDKSLLECFE